MKVLFIANQPDLPETHMILGIHASGIPVTVIGQPGMARAEQFEQAGITVHTLRFRRRIDWNAIRRLRQMLLSGEYTLAHTLMNRPLSNVLIAARGLPVKIVAYRGVVGNLPRWNPSSWLTYLNPRIDCVACVCDAIKDYLEDQGVPPHRARRIYKGHDVSWYPSATRAELCERFQIPADAVIVSAAATMRPRKGTALLLEAAPLVSAGARPVHYLLMGTLRDRNVVQDRLKGDLRNRIHFTGHLTDAPRWAGASDLFVLPALRREGLPEAMAQGVPAIVSGAGGSLELVRHQKDGWVCEAGHKEELVAALNRLVNDEDLRATLGASARQRIVQDFNIQQTIAEYLDLYTSLHDEYGT